MLMEVIVRRGCEIKKIGVVGPGMMGHAIAQEFAVT
jgi:3-hydroxyacyl-CoA dehydrogenase